MTLFLQTNFINWDIELNDDFNLSLKANESHMILIDRNRLRLAHQCSNLKSAILPNTVGCLPTPCCLSTLGTSCSHYRLQRRETVRLLQQWLFEQMNSDIMLHFTRVAAISPLISYSCITQCTLAVCTRRHRGGFWTASMSGVKGGWGPLAESIRSLTSLILDNLFILPGPFKV